MMDFNGLIASLGLLQISFFAIGILMLIFEMFHPGFGVPGISGLVLLLIGVAMSARSLLEALVMLIVIIAILGVAFSFVLNSAKKGRLSRILVLHNSAKKEAGYIGIEDLGHFLNKKGITLTVLRPAGTAEFDGAKIDVVSESEFIPKGTTIEVIKVEGRRVVVRPNI